MLVSLEPDSLLRDLGLAYLGTHLVSAIVGVPFRMVGGSAGQFAARGGGLFELLRCLEGSEERGQSTWCPDQGSGQLPKSSSEKSNINNWKGDA